MNRLLAFSLLLFLPTSAFAQSVNSYSVRATGDQVVPGPGLLSPGSLTGFLTVSTDSSGSSLHFLGTSLGVLDVTEVAIHGPSTAASTGPVLVAIPFTQQINSLFASASLFDLPIPAATRDLIVGGQAYIEVRSLLLPGGALRGAIASNESLCTPQAPSSPTCGQCPCGNAPLSGSGGGCRNSEGNSARLIANGVAALSADSLDFSVARASSNSVALLISGNNLLPLGNSACAPGMGITGGLTDGLRCVGGQTLRHGVRPTDADGATTPGAFTPTGGLLAQNAFMAGQSRAFQAFYRDVSNSPCGTGLNTTNAVLLSFVL